jgi:hypothetical protein
MPGRGSMSIRSGKLSDSKREHYDFPHLAGCGGRGKIGEHLITVRAYDRYDNVGVAKTVIPAQGAVGAMRFELYVAARYLKAKRRQAVVGVVTAISIAGVTAGVAALIIALAITNGMRRDLQDKLLGSSAHVQLMQWKGAAFPTGWRCWRALRQVPHVTAAAPGLYEQVVVARGARDGYALIEGILPDDERTVSDLLSTATPGAVQALEPHPRTRKPAHAGQGIAADRSGQRPGRHDRRGRRRFRHGHQPAGRMTPMGGLIPKYMTLSRCGDISLRLLSVRRPDGLSAPRRRAAPLR